MKNKFLSPLDIHFAELMTRLSGTGSEALFLAAALASHYRGEGHICFDLSNVAGKNAAGGRTGFPVCPDLEKLDRRALKKDEPWGNRESIGP